MKKVLSAVFALSFVALVQAQSGCPFINIGPDMNLPCTQPCTTLSATYFNTGATSTYSVSQIAYSPQGFGGTPVLIGVDDQWSPVVSLPFNFCFFGQSYNQFVIGSNGVISFDITNAGNGNTYTPVPIPSPTPADLTNCIMCPWQDIDPTNQGDIYFQVAGTYPCRTFVISWVNVSYYGDPNSVSPGSCGGALYATQQIVLYETTNVIDMNIQNKESCAGWVGGVATQGIQDATGGTAFIVPGRNGTVWTCQNDSWRFTPNGPSIVSISWALNGAPIGTGDNITVCPSTYGVYSATATYQPCPGNTPVVVDDYMFLGTLNLTVNIDSVRNPSCGLNNGVVYASYNTTSAVLSYGWTPGPQNTTTLSNVGPGTYIFQTDIAGCTRYDTATIVDTGSIIVVVNDSAFTSCAPPGNAGVLCAYPSGGQNPYTYVWSNTQTGSCATGLIAGSYTVTATDAGGCTATDGGTVSYTYQSPSLAPPQITNVTCNGGSDGQIIVSPVNLQPPVSYSWSGGAPNNDTITGLIAATYTVVATDANGCTASATYNVTQPSAITIGSPTITQATCSAGGSITVSASGGTGALTYTWSNAQNGPAINNLAAGPYTVVVTDQNLCTATATYNVTAASNVITFGAPVIVDVACNGGSNGSIIVNASGGTGAITFVWSNTQTGPAINNLPAGTYSVTATDANACSVSTSYIITEPTAIVFGTPTTTATTCSAGGSIAVSASGGTGTITFTWSNLQTGDSITNAPAGPYTVTATDQNLCTATATYSVPAGPGAILISNPVIVDVSCFGGNDGSISVTATGGTGTITSVWSNTQTGTSATALIAGSYSIVSSDINGCSATATYVVAEPTPLVIDSANIQNIGCVSGSTGSIAIYVSGGTPGYTYSWVQLSNSQSHSGQTISGLSADTYDVTVTDLNSCTTASSYTVTQVAALTFAQSQTEVSCNGGNDGTATITVNTGTAPYNYDWNGTGASPDSTLTGITAGTVNVTITDANCSATATFTITEPTAVIITLVSQTDVSCNSGSDGSISISVNGGTPSYTSVWSNSQTGLTATALPAGSITVVTTDANFCTATQTYTLTEPTLLTAVADATDALCYMGTGSITVTASNGTPPYTYFWSDAQTTPTASALLAGVYTCTVTDANACTVSVSSVVNEPTDRVIQAVGYPVKCIGDANGYIIVSVTGGTPPYNPAATQDGTNFFYETNGVIEGLAVGTYTVQVADANGCLSQVLVTVPDATPDAFTTTTDSTTCYGSDYTDGAAHIIANSILNTPYWYSIDGGVPQRSEDFYNLSAGSHTITVVNFYGCTTQVQVYVFEPLPIEVNIVPDSLVLPLGESGSVQVVHLNASSVTYSWTPVTGLSCMDCPNPVVTVYQRGDFIITVSSQNGTSTCYGTATLHVEVEPHKPVFIPNAFTPNGDGNNDLFQIYGEDIKLVDLKIFNRWGELVYKTNNAFGGWDGTFKGQMQNPAVFTYTAIVTFLDDKKVEKGGTVALVR